MYTIIHNLPYYYEISKLERRIYPVTMTSHSLVVDFTKFRVITQSLPIYSEHELRAKLGNGNISSYVQAEDKAESSVADSEKPKETKKTKKTK